MTTTTPAEPGQPSPDLPPRTTPAPAAAISKLGIVAVIVTVVLWASAFVGIRAVGPSFSPDP